MASTYYDAYFDAQVGRGNDSPDVLETVYTEKKSQRGSGIGGCLRGIYRSVLPLLKKGTHEVGKEAVRAGFNVVKDVTHNKLPFKDALKRRIQESGHNLKRKAEERLDRLLNDRTYKKVKSSRDLHSVVSSDDEQSEREDEKRKSNKVKIKTEKNKKNNKSVAVKKRKKPIKLRSITDIFKNN